MGTDIWLVPAKSQIQMHKVKYRGTPIFGDNGEEYVKYLPGEVKYVGEPSDEIDEAWNELTKSKSSIQMHQTYELILITSYRALLPSLRARGQDAIRSELYKVLERRLGRLCCEVCSRVSSTDDPLTLL